MQFSTAVNQMVLQKVQLCKTQNQNYLHRLYNSGKIISSYCLQIRHFEDFLESKIWKIGSEV